MAVAVVVTFNADGTIERVRLALAGGVPTVGALSRTGAGWKTPRTGAIPHGRRKVRYAGEPVALVVVEDRYLAEDAL